MMTGNIFRSLASSRLNPLSKIKSFSIGNGNLGAFAYFCSTGTSTAEQSSPSPPPSSLSLDSAPKDTLFRRMMNATNPKDPTFKEPISQILEKWVGEGREVDILDVRHIIRQFRNFRRYSHALQISEWTGSIENLKLSFGDTAVHLDLISKVHGLEQAERYFESMPDNSKCIQTYGALLNCYVRAKLLDKAEAVMQKMGELGYVTVLAYNNMLNLYSQMGKQEKLKTLVQEMENKGVTFDQYSYHILLNAYVSASDIAGMEKLLRNIEADPLIVMEWIAYSIAANGYLKAGDKGNAEIMLKKSAELIKDGKNRGLSTPDKVGLAIEFLTSQYANMGRKDEVHRLWRMHPKPRKFLNRSYYCIISCLLKLDDVDSAHTMLDTWLSKKVNFDIRIPNLLVTAFCKKGDMGRAESIVSSLVEMGEQPDANTWSRIAWGYWQHKQMEDAVRITKKAISIKPGRKPDAPVLVSCLKYLKEKGDAAGAEEIVRLLEEGDKFPETLRDKLSEYLGNGDPSAPAMELDQTMQESETCEEESLDGAELKLRNAS